MTFLPEISRMQALESKVDKLERRVAELMQESARAHVLLAQVTEATAGLSEAVVELGHRTMRPKQSSGGGGLG
jgi:hypothetical protein